MTIENQLAALLKANGSLEFPGLGVFSINYQPAKIDYIQQKITPPGRFVSFDSTTSTLSSDHANIEGLDPNEWNYYLDGVKNRLNKRETVVIQGFGSIYQDFRNEVHFLPSQLNYDDNSYGLSTIHATPVTRDPKETITLIPETKMPLTVKSKNWSSYISELAFSILIGLSLLTVGFGFWYAINTKKEARIPSKFQIAESTLEGQRRLEDILDYDAKWATPGYYDEEPVAEENVNLRPTNKKEAKTIKRENLNKPVSIPAGKTYKIAVGSFSSEANAEVLLKKLNKLGFTSTTERTATGMSRVVVIKFGTAAEVNTALSKLKNKINPQAYIYH